MVKIIKVKIFILLLMLPSLSLLADDNENSVRAVLMQTWNKTDAPLIVDPITIVDNYALAGWVQGERGGRALLLRKPDGIWSVQLCGGDGLKDVETLKQSHLPDPVATELAARQAAAEAVLPSKTREQFSKFGATLHMAH
jgi:hypothetical protein